MSVQKLALHKLNVDVYHDCGSRTVLQKPKQTTAFSVGFSKMPRWSKFPLLRMYNISLLQKRFPINWRKLDYPVDYIY